MPDQKPPLFLLRFWRIIAPKSRQVNRLKKLDHIARFEWLILLRRGQWVEAIETMRPAANNVGH